MSNVHHIEGRRADAPRLADAATCNHGDWLSTEGDAIRCLRCLSQLVMLPYKPGEFRLEWLTPNQLAIRSIRCAA